MSKHTKSFFLTLCLLCSFEISAARTKKSQKLFNKGKRTTPTADYGGYKALTKAQLECFKETLELLDRKLQDGKSLTEQQRNTYDVLKSHLNVRNPMWPKSIKKKKLQSFCCAYVSNEKKKQLESLNKNWMTNHGIAKKRISKR